MKRNRFLICDALLWTVLMILAAVVAFNLLQRDKQRSFGAVSFGSFPEFSLKTLQGGTFDRHQIKGYVWAVHTAPSVDEAMAVARQLVIIENQTASGKRHMNILTVSASFSDLTALMPYHYIAGGSQQEVDRIFSGVGHINASKVFLVDQNGIIRGQYDFKDVDQYRDFQKDLLRIL